MEETLEKKLISNVMPILEKCRPGWDKHHTLAVVYWMKELIKKEGGDAKILITASYLHDVGYFNLIKNYPYKYDEMMEKPKQNHGKRGVGIARGILQNLGGYSILEKEEILHLVEIHDDLDELKTYNELLLFELKADGNNKIGIITELYFYCSIMKRIRNDQCRYGKYVIPYLDRIAKTNKIMAYFFAPDLHPLIDKPLVDIMNAAMAPEVRFYYLRFPADAGTPITLIF